MTIQQLRYVTVICDEGSLNKASEQLYIAHEIIFLKQMMASRKL